MRQYYAIQSDNRFSANPLVTGEAGIRFYAGILLCTPSAQNIGTLCVIDTKPRDLSGVEIDMLRDLAGLVVDELELRQIATTDSLTGLGTRRCLKSDGAMEIARARRYERSLGCVALDIDYFKSINDRYGHAA